MPADPFDPPEFKHKRLPNPSASASPPVPIMHSPTRPVIVKDQQDWKIPPCISNWINPKGCTIPLDKRLATDGRALRDVHINNNFVTLSEALYLSEHKAREAVAIRSKLQKEIFMKEKERKERELRALAQKARSERTASAAALDTFDMMRIHYEHASAYEKEDHLPKETMEEQRMLREKVREERRRERERERRLEDKDVAIGKTKKSKITRDRDRDISKKVALCMASSAGGAGRGGEVMYDQRLFNQDKGMDSGFATDDQYHVYDKVLFTAQPTLSTIYSRPNKGIDVETYGNAEQLRMTGPRDGPLEFEEDYFGLGQFSSEVNIGKKALKEVGARGSMRASAGSSMRDGYEGGSSRTHAHWI